MQIERHDEGPRMSQVVVHNGVVYLSGQVADDAGGDVQAQTRAVLKKIDGHLASVGTDRTRLLSAMIWLRDIDCDFQAMNQVWEAWIETGAKPARATVGARLARPELKVEIQVVAAL